MVDVLDVATAIIERAGSLTTFQLQKLTFYVQAWHATIYGEPLFAEEFQAWKNGPVAPVLHDRYRGMKSVGSLTFGDSSKLDGQSIALVELVLSQYGLLDGDELSAISHSEMPWIAARGSLDPSELSRTTVTIQSMVDFYSSKVLAGHSAAEIALIGVNPTVLDEESAIATIRELLSEWAGREFVPVNYEDGDTVRLVSEMDFSSFTEEDTAIARTSL